MLRLTELSWILVEMVFYRDADKSEVSNSIARHNPSVWECNVAGFFADSAPMGFVWSHPHPSNSIQIQLLKGRGAVSRDPEVSVCIQSETSTVENSHGQPATGKETSFCLKPFISTQSFSVTH